MNALKKLWAREIKKKGVNKMPLIKDPAIAFINDINMNELKDRFNARSTAIFASPNLKKGTTLGMIISTYENKSARAQKYAVLLLLCNCIIIILIAF